MVQELGDRGVCSTCIYRSNCLSLKNSMKEGKPVLHCEEFDDPASEKDIENRCLLNTFATLPCFGIKKMIPGGEA